MLAYQRLLTNTEATYKNYFRNSYATYGMALEKNIRNISARLKGGYIPQISYKVYIPKPNGLNRMYTIMSMDDQIVYQAFANKIADQMQIDSVTRRYGKMVFGNLYNGKDSTYFFRQWEKSYKAYTKAIISAYKGGNEYLASFDLTACYDSINHNLLKDILLKYHFSENCAKEFIGMLESWCSPSTKYLLGTGIPQGPQASGIIAEAVLSEYDGYVEKLMKRYQFKYYRYVDDIKILAKNEETVKWILFLLDKKSKELGLFPQASKVSVHKVENIEDEVKLISKPLFEDDVEEEDKPAISEQEVVKLIKQKSKDVTTLKRYFQHIKPTAKNNVMALKLIRSYPEMMPSFIYYVKRYPRKLPPSIVEFIRKCCLDKTKQYYAGALLQASVRNMTATTISELGNIAKSLLKDNKQNEFIFDLFFKAQLYLLLILSNKYKKETYIKMIRREENWWIKQQLISDIVRCDAPVELTTRIINASLVSSNPDEALAAAIQVISWDDSYNLPNRNTISSVAQEALKSAGIINRSKYSNSQINKNLELITSIKFNFQWKKVLGAEHDYIERVMYAAVAYWRSDLTAFVNLWDTIDDRILSVLTSQHSELGGYTLGNVGGIVSSGGLKSNLPRFHNMVNEIHRLRLSSYLSHTQVKNTGEYTGPIPYKKKTNILKLICEGMEEVTNYW